MATPTQPTTYATRNDIALDNRLQMIDLLNANMATMFDLYSQLKQAHWNVKGMNFIALHELFDMLAEEALPFVDMMAERATALGGEANGTLRMAAANTALPAFEMGDHSGEAMVRIIADRVSVVAQATRTAIKTAEDADDMATSDVFVEITRALDKQLYFLEAHLQG